MSFFPAGFDYNSPTLALFQLVNINTPDGDFGFMLGTDGTFTDVTGKAWVGSRLISAEGVGFGLSGTAKASSVTLSFFEDPADPSGLVDEVKALGAAYVKGRSLTRYLQVFEHPDQMLAPVHAPRQYAQITMASITTAAPNPLTRTITLNLEGTFRIRGAAPRKVYNTTDHARQLGVANPSYEFIPVEPREERNFLS